jgi:hypothetical protein
VPLVRRKLMSRFVCGARTLCTQGYHQRPQCRTNDCRHHRRVGRHPVERSASLSERQRGQPSAPQMRRPSSQPSSKPSSQPSTRLSEKPSEKPSTQPSGQPSAQPSRCPSGQPSGQPSGRPSSQPSASPSSRPSSQPSAQPSTTPTQQPQTHVLRRRRSRRAVCHRSRAR